MLEDGHIFTIKTKDAANVADIKAGGNDIIISGLNVLKDQIRVGDFVFWILKVYDESAFKNMFTIVLF